MAEATFNDVILKMKQEGELDRNSGAHSIKSVKALLTEGNKTVVDVLNSVKNVLESMLSNLNIMSQNSIDVEELLQSAEERQKRAADLESEKTEGKDSAKGVKGKTSFFGDIDFKKEGSLLGTALVAGLAIWASDLDQWFRTAFVSIKLGERISKVFKITKYADDIVAGMSKAGRAAENSLGIFSKIISKISSFFKLIGETKVVSGLLSKLSFLGPILKKGARGLWFVNIFFILFDFFEGFIKGTFGEDGSILKGLRMGAAEVINGLINEPINLLKNIAGWMAGKLGFEGVKTALESVNFDLLGILQSGVDAVLFVVNKIRNWFTSVTESLDVEKIFSSIPSPIMLIVNIENAISKFLFNAFSRIAGFFGFERIESFFKDLDLKKLFGMIIEGVQNVFTYIRSIFTIENIQSVVGDGIELIQQLFSRIIDTVTGVLQKVLDGAIELIPEGIRKRVGLLTNEEQKEEKRKELQETSEQRKKAEENVSEYSRRLQEGDYGGLFGPSREEIEKKLYAESLKASGLAQKEEQLRRELESPSTLQDTIVEKPVATEETVGLVNATNERNEAKQESSIALMNAPSNDNSVTNVNAGTTSIQSLNVAAVPQSPDLRYSSTDASLADF